MRNTSKRKISLTLVFLAWVGMLSFSLSNAGGQTALSGKDLFKANCSGCHFSDRTDKKAGPGLLGLFKNPALPASGRTPSEENVRETIVDGRGRMPSFKHLQDSEINALVDYLKSL
jgi:mono/diheme cytochrome c family protein